MIVGRKQIFGERSFAVLLLVPAFLILVGVILLPLIDAVRMSFTITKLTSLHKHKYVGFRNYERIFTDPTYWEVVKNTFLIVGISVGISLLIGFALAVALNDTKRGSGLLRAFYIIPWLVPGVVIGITWSWVLGTETGVVNYILKSLGFIQENLPWLADKTLSNIAVNMVFVWSSVPFIMVTILAGLKAIPSDFMEAAIVDGASFWQRLRFITIPLLMPIIAITTTLRIIYTMQNFVIIYMITQGGPGYATETFALYVYETAFNSARLGRATAIGTTWFLFLLIFVALYLKLVVKEEKIY